MKNPRKPSEPRAPIKPKKYLEEIYSGDMLKGKTLSDILEYCRKLKLNEIIYTFEGENDLITDVTKLQLEDIWIDIEERESWYMYFTYNFKYKYKNNFYEENLNKWKEDNKKYKKKLEIYKEKLKKYEEDIELYKKHIADKLDSDVQKEIKALENRLKKLKNVK